MLPTKKTGLLLLYCDYSYLGGDCTNYVSQAIYEGTLHHDNPPQWWGNQAGGSAAWIYPGGLGNFLKTNNGTGPHASEISNPCNLRQADVIQLWTDGEEGGEGGYWLHSMIVVSNHVSNCWRYGPGNTILYNSHSYGYNGDRYHYPFSHFIGQYDGIRYLKITGWK